MKVQNAANMSGSFGERLGNRWQANLCVADDARKINFGFPTTQELSVNPDPIHRVLFGDIARGQRTLFPRREFPGSAAAGLKANRSISFI